jgi:hypothetical protein
MGATWFLDCNRVSKRGSLQLHLRTEITGKIQSDTLTSNLQWTSVRIALHSPTFFDSKEAKTFLG